MIRLSASEPWVLGGIRFTRLCCWQQQRSQALAEYLGILAGKAGHMSINQPAGLGVKHWSLASLSPALLGAPLWREAPSQGLGSAGVQDTKPGGESDLGRSLEISGVMFRSQGSPIRGENGDSKTRRLRSNLPLSDFRSFSLPRAQVL